MIPEYTPCGVYLTLRTVYYIFYILGCIFNTLSGVYYYTHCRETVQVTTCIYIESANVGFTRIENDSGSINGFITPLEPSKAKDILCFNNTTFTNSVDTNIYNNPDICKPGANTNHTSPYSFMDKHSGIKVAHHNIRSLPPKIDLLKIALNHKPIDILAINETWLDDTIRNDDINIPGYCTERRDRSRHGGGVLFYINETMNYKLREDLENPLIEAIWIELKIPKSHKTIIICSFYRPPNSNIQYIEHLIDVIDKIDTDTSELVILGDFNINYDITRSDTQIGDICHLFDMEQLIQEPTRNTITSSKIIDLVLTTNRKLHGCSGTINYNISDHYPVYTILHVQNSPKSKPRQFKMRDFKNFNQENFLEDLSNNLHNLIFDENISTSWDNFKSVFTQVCHKHAPLKEIRVKERHNPWINRIILDAQYKRDHLHKNAIQLNDANIFNEYRSMRNQVTTMIKQAQREYYQNELQKSKNDSRKMWATLKHLTNKKRNTFIPPDLTADQFNNYFIKIGQKLGAKFDKESLPDWHETIPTPSDPFTITQLSITSVSKEIRKLPDRSNQDLLEMDSKLLRISFNVISPFITHLFNLSIKSGSIPEDWKIARVTPVFKNKGSKKDTCNYRPISVVTHLSKILETCIQTQLMQYLEIHNLISSDQSAFMKKHSTQTSLHKLMDDIITTKDTNTNILMCFLDIQKCFDTIDHKLLLHKLSKYGIQNTSLSWFSSYLTNRRQTVTCNGKLSDFMDISIGIPQGSGLGPVLFLLFINDLPYVTDNFSFNLYADDTIIYKKDTDIANLIRKFDTDVPAISEWYKRNKLTLNTTKTEFLLIGKDREKAPPQIEFENEKLSVSDTVKYLGIHIDSNINWNCQISSIEKKVKPHIFILNRLRHILNKTQLLTIYNTIIEPTIHYCDTVWGYCSKTNVNKLNRLKRRCARAITGNYDWNIPGGKLMESLNIPTFEMKRDYDTACLTYKAINEQTAKYLTNKISPVTHNHKTRFNSTNNLSIPRPKHEFARQTFTYTTSHCWNDLNQETKKATTYKEFKCKYKKEKPFYTG